MLVFSKAKITHYHPLLSQQNFTFCGKLGLFLPQYSDRCFRDGMLEPVLKLQTKYPFYYRKPETQHSWFWSEGVKLSIEHKQSHTQVKTDRDQLLFGTVGLRATRLPAVTTVGAKSPIRH